MKFDKWFLFFLVVGCTSRTITPQLAPQKTPTQSLLQAISIVDENTVWISGHNATAIRTTNGGQTWDTFTHPTNDTIQFRDIHAFDDQRAILMSAGPGSQSRIFSLEDNNWQENFVMNDSLGFLDCIAFWDDLRGIAYGDKVDAYPYILITSDGGSTWNRKIGESMPLAGDGEGGFAASGTCVTTGENGAAWIATGAGGNARILLTSDYGQSWTAVNSPIIKGDAAGNTSISFAGNTGFVTGGDLMKPNEYTENCAYSFDGGKSWSLANQPMTTGAFYGGAITQLDDLTFTFACGPNGLDYSANNGQTWSTLDTLNYWAVSFQNHIGYASGRNGAVLKISLQ